MNSIYLLSKNKRKPIKKWKPQKIYFFAFDEITDTDTISNVCIHALFISGKNGWITSNLKEVWKINAVLFLYIFCLVNSGRIRAVFKANPSGSWIHLM